MNLLNLVELLQTRMTGDTNPPRSKISDEERTELMKKMDKDLAEHFASLEAKARERGPRTSGFVDGFTEETWEQEMANHPFFKKDFCDGEELSPMMQGLQVILAFYWPSLFYILPHIIGQHSEL